MLKFKFVVAKVFYFDLQDTSLRKKKGAQSSKSIDENALDQDPTKTVKKANTTEAESNSASNSLGRKQNLKAKSKSVAGSEFKYASSDLEGMMFGSLGRPLKADKDKVGFIFKLLYLFRPFSYTLMNRLSSLRF